VSGISRRHGQRECDRRHNARRRALANLYRWNAGIPQRNGAQKGRPVTSEKASQKAQRLAWRARNAEHRAHIERLRAAPDGPMILTRTRPGPRPRSMLLVQAEGVMLAAGLYGAWTVAIGTLRGVRLELYERDGDGVALFRQEDDSGLLEALERWAELEARGRVSDGGEESDDEVGSC